MAGRAGWARRAVERDDGTAFSLIQFKSACTQIGPPEVSPKMHSAESWTVLAGPEGNEFCVVRPKETLIR